MNFVISTFSTFSREKKRVSKILSICIANLKRKKRKYKFLLTTWTLTLQYSSYDFRLLVKKQKQKKNVFILFLIFVFFLFSFLRRRGTLRYRLPLLYRTESKWSWDVPSRTDNRVRAVLLSTWYYRHRVIRSKH